MIAQQLPDSLKKLIRSLHRKKLRYEQELYIGEGYKITEEALLYPEKVECLLVSEAMEMTYESMINNAHDYAIPVYKTTTQIFESLSDTSSPQGILAVLKLPPMIEPDMTQPFLALDTINDPGNVGTIIRTAEWFGVSNIILSENTADPFNPKSVRASMGSVLRVRHYQTSLFDFLSTCLPTHEIFGADVKATTSLRDSRPKSVFGIVVGSEAHGISENLVPLLTHRFIITGSGHAESINVGIATGISLYHFADYFKQYSDY